MLVSKDNLKEVIRTLQAEKETAWDTETDGLRPYHGNRLIGISCANSQHSFYFNFHDYIDVDPAFILNKNLIKEIIPLWDETQTLFFHNAKFDLAFLSHHIDVNNIRASIHDTMSIERLIYTDEVSYSLEDTAKRRGLEKSDALERWVEENGEWEWETRAGKQARTKNKRYFKAPLSIIEPYARQDAHITYLIGQDQKKALQGIKLNETVNINKVYENEKKLTHAVFHMEHRGCKVDLPYCERATRFEKHQMGEKITRFKELTNEDYKASALLFKKVFESDKENWSYTEKRNASFDSETLKKFKSEAAKVVLGIRDAKSKMDFYEGFTYYADSNGAIHPNFNNHGTATGRFSSSHPNFQNLTNEEGEEEKEFITRRAIIPRDGFVFIMPDYSAMEYRLMLDYAADLVGYETPLLKEVKNGKDIHQATADLIKERSGLDIGRSRAKNANFATLYGSGHGTLAKTIGGTVEEAQRLKKSLFQAAPEIQTFIQVVMRCATERGSVTNWAGRQAHFPDKNFAYRAPNYLIQGGCADIIKIAMVKIWELLKSYESKMIMTIHDELVVEVHQSEISVVPRKILDIMETVYPFKYLPMKVDMAWSDISLGDKKEGWPE